MSCSKHCGVEHFDVLFFFPMLYKSIEGKMLSIS